MRYILTFTLFAFLAISAYAANGLEEVTMPKTGWRSDYDLTRAENFIANENFEDSLDILEKILRRNIKSIDAHVLSGYAHFKLNNFQRAEKHLFSVIDLDPRHMGAHLYLAEMDLKAGKIKKVEERLQLLKMICKGTDCGEYQYLKRRLLTLNKDNSEK